MLQTVKVVFKEAKLVYLAFFFGVFFCLAIISSAQTNQNQKPENEEERLLRVAIIKAVSSPDFELAEDFTFAIRHIDLNGDGRDEVVVWIPEADLGGTSGYPVIIFSQTQDGYKKLWEDEQAWTPIILLKSKSRGWRDIALQYGGGGATWHFGIFRYNGKSYRIYKTQKKQPQGEVLIEKNWQQTTFGPIPKQ